MNRCGGSVISALDYEVDFSGFNVINSHCHQPDKINIIRKVKVEKMKNLIDAIRIKHIRNKNGLPIFRNKKYLRMGNELNKCLI